MVAHAAKLEKLHFSEELTRPLRSLGSKLQYGQGAMISNTSRIENKVTVAENVKWKTENYSTWPIFVYRDQRAVGICDGIKFLMKFD